MEQGKGDAESPEDLRAQGQAKAKAAKLRARAAKLKLKASKLELKANTLRHKVREYEELASKLDRSS
jgi:hypothetical protein